MMENNTRECKKCHKFVVRLFLHDYGDGKNKKWVDDNARQWNGRECPECNVDRARETMKKARNHG